MQIIMLANAGHKAFDTRIFHKEARSLQQAGFTVSIIIPHDKDEVREGISILSVPIHRKGFGKLIVSPWLVFRRALRQSADAWFHLHDSELLWIGVLLRMLGRKVIYDAHEDTPLQISYQHWIPRMLRTPYAWFYFLLEKFCGRIFQGVIVAEPVIAKYFPKRKTVVIRNFPSLLPFQKELVPKYEERERIVIYVGLLSEARGVKEMAQAAELVRSRLQFRFILGGDFSPASLQKMILDLYPVEFLGWLSFEKLVDLLYQSRIGIIVPHPLERYKTNYPVKLFEYMAAGLPVIASRHGESSAFIRESNAGILVDPLNPTEIANAIIWLFEHEEDARQMGENGKKYVKKFWNWELEEKKIIDFYKQLLHQ